jgi:hypothetical protein
MSSKRLPHHSFVRYDVSGVPAERIQDIIEADWYHLYCRRKRVLNSPNYLREDGKPVIAIWGEQPSQSSVHVSVAYAQLPSPPKVWASSDRNHTPELKSAH